jgi:hypothetical protein
MHCAHANGKDRCGRTAAGDGDHNNLPRSAPAWHVPLPWNPDPRRVGAGLAQRSAAVVEWIDTIGVGDVLDVKGQVPPAVMSKIERELTSRALEEGD